MRTLLTGDYEHRDFRHAVAWLERHAELDRVADLGRAAQRLGQLRDGPRLIVVAQPRPGQFATAEIEGLHRAAPLARLAALLGSWCEGEARSGRPWPGVERIYWHQWRPRLGALLDAGAADVPPAWRLPRTASAAERLLSARPAPTVARRGLIGIASFEAAGYAALADTCIAAGYAAVWLNPRQPTLADGMDAVLWNGGGMQAAEMQLLREWSERVRPARVMALVSFPRIDDIDRLRTAGAGSVLSKPLMNEDLHRELERLLKSQLRSAEKTSSTSAA